MHVRNIVFTDIDAKYDDDKREWTLEIPVEGGFGEVEKALALDVGLNRAQIHEVVNLADKFAVGNYLTARLETSDD